MKTDDFNKFYDYNKELKKAIYNIVGVRFCNIPRSRNSVIRGKMSNRSSTVFEVLNNKNKFLYEKKDNYYIAYDENIGAYSFLKEDTSGYERNIKIKNYGVVFSKKGITKAKLKLRELSSSEIAKTFDIDVVFVGMCKMEESFAFQKSFYVDKKVIDYKLAQAGINILDYDNEILNGVQNG